VPKDMLGRPGQGRAPDVEDDGEQTSPLPTILPGATSLPRPGPVEAPRGPFEAARPVNSRPVSITGSVAPPQAETRPAIPPAAGDSAAPSAAAEADPAQAGKLEQLKDLYLTAEAIGEDNLDKHFDQVSERQRQLIREFFERSGPGA
jgi:hypothetical protein